MKSMLIRLAIAGSLVLSVAACSSLNVKAPNIPAPQLNKLPPFVQIIRLIDGPSEEDLEKQRIKRELAALPITHPRRQEEFSKIWKNVVRHTETMPISDGRIRIRSEGTLFAGENISEQNFFIRAAAETIKSGHDGFVVMHLDYYSPTPRILRLTPNVTFNSRRWLGNYEDFLENRNEQNMFSSRTAVENKILDGVILVMNEDDYPNRDRFDAQDIYLNLLTHKSQ